LEEEIVCVLSNVDAAIEADSVYDDRFAGIPGTCESCVIAIDLCKLKPTTQVPDQIKRACPNGYRIKKE
jgi:hypothetical protein